MSVASEPGPASERAVAALLVYGTWLASVVMAAGLIARSAAITTAGIALLVALPVLRVLVLVVAFARHPGQRRFAAVAVLVAAIIGVGLAIGVTSR
jgi:uncharacterized membrane protein